MQPPVRLLSAFLSCFLGGTLTAQLEIIAIGEPVTVNFDVVGSPDCQADVPWTDNETIPYCYTDRPTYNYSEGCANDGGLHLAGMNGETALGGRSSNQMSSFRWGVRFKNSTGVALSGLQVQVRSEQWSKAESNVQNTVQFGYRAASAAITDVVNGTYVPDPALNLTNFTAPGGCAGYTTAIDGNSPVNSALLEACLAVTLQPGDEIMLRWYDTNDPCNDHLLCVDDLEVTGLPFPTLTADGPTQVCEGGSVTLSVEQADAVLWNTGATGPMLIVTEPGIYTATCTTPCGSSITLTQEVEVAKAATIAVTPSDTLICPGSTVELTAVANAGGLLWSTGETSTSIIVDDAGTYSVTTTSSCGTAEVSATVELGDAPIASIAASSGTTLCSGSEVTLTASGGAEYLWSTGHAGAVLIVDAAGPFTVTVSNSCGTDEAYIALVELDAPEVSLDASSDVICADGTILLTATGTGPFVWNNGESTSAITIATPGTYTVYSTNECGTTSSSTTITDGRFEASFTATPLEGTAPLPVNAVEMIAQGVALSWDTDNGESFTDPAITTTYSAPGVYTITLTATDPNTGCTSLATAEINVLPGLSWVRMPNVFTPNGDGTNEGLRVEYEALAALDCSILNRWGQEVGHLKHPDDVWTGRDVSGLVPEGTYYYVLRADGADGRTHTMQGSITVLR